MKTLFRNTLPFFFLLTILSAAAQVSQQDSLESIISSGRGKQKADALNKLARLLMYDKPEEAKNYIQQAIKVSKEDGYQLGIGDGYNTIGIIYDVSGKYDSSIYYYEKALSIFIDIKDVKGRGSATNNLGLIYWNQGNYNLALEYFFRALKDFEAIKNNDFIGNALNNIGLVYNDIKKYDKALEYHRKALHIYEQINDPYYIGAVYNNFGNTFFNLLKYDSAAFYYRQAIEKQTLAKDAYGLSTAYNGYAGTLMVKKDFKGALDVYQKALSIKHELKEKLGESSIYQCLAGIYKETGNRQLRLLYLDSARVVSEENNFKNELIDIYKNLAEYYDSSNLPLSYQYFKKYNSVKDSVFNETSNKQITELNTRYETQKKEQQLRLQHSELQRKNYLLWGLIAILALLIFSAISFYRRKKVQENLKLQRVIMQEQDSATRAVLIAEENERKRIAADLHDGVGQMMSAAKMNLSVFENELVFKNDQQKLSFENVLGLIDESCKEIRNVSHQMMPNALLKTGLASAIKEFIDKLDARVLKVSLHTEGLNEGIDKNTETVLYRVIQECVNNVLKHAAADKLDISLIKDEDGISATIEDNGKGFDSNYLQQVQGIGLKNIISRITFLKGTIEFDSAPGKGTLVAIHVPLR